MCLGIPGRVVELTDPAQHVATVEVSGVRRAVSVRLLAPVAADPEAPSPVQVGDWVLVHVGFALAVVDEAEAAATLAALRALGSAYDDEVAAFAGSGGTR